MYPMYVINTAPMYVTDVYASYDTRIASVGPNT